MNSSKPRRLTKTTLDRAKPRAKIYELRDPSLPGFTVRVHPSGTKKFCVRRRVRGAGERRVSIGTYSEALTLDQARKIASELLGRFARGEDPSRARRESLTAPTFADAARRFMEEHARPYLKPRTVQGYEILLRKHLLPRLARHKLAAIQLADIERAHREIGATAKGAANRALALAKAVLNKAIAWGMYEGSNPAQHVKRYREQAKERFLTAEERQRLERAFEIAEGKRRGMPGYVSPGAVAALRLLSITGARLTEITGLTWDMVDWEHSCLRLPDSKVDAIILYMSSHTMGLLRDLHAKRRVDTPYVCPSLGGRELRNMQRAWRSICKTAGLEDVRIHDLRHSAASDMINAGQSLEMVAAKLGHKDIRTSRRYAHLHNEAVRAAIEAADTTIVERSRGESNVVPLRSKKKTG